jgi:ADP-heptose:LPS heptosyltransferase
MNLPAAALHPIVIRFGRLGDMVLLSPLLHLLRRRYRRPCWLIGSGPWSTQLYGSDPDVARIWSLSGRHTPLLLGPTWWRVLLALRHSGNAPVYVCETPESQRLHRIRAVLGLAGVAPQRCLFLTDDGTEQHEHRIDALLRFGRQTPAALPAEQYPCEEVRAAPQIRVADKTRLECQAWLHSRGWAGLPIILIQPGNRRTMRWHGRRSPPVDDKEWLLSNWSALLQRLHDSLPQAQIVLCGSRQERALLRRIGLLSGLDQVNAVHLPIGRLLALCELAHSTISVDTGTAHVAAAVGSPLVVLFGSTWPQHWLPRGACETAIIGLGGAPGGTHVNQISVAAVFEAWRSLPARH